MAVGGFLDSQVEPSALVLVVGPGLHVLVQVILRLRQTLEHAVDQGHGLGAGDLLVGLEGTVLIALDPTVVGGDADLVLRPVAGHVGEGRRGLVAVRVEPGCDRSELGAADRRVRLKGTVLIALDDPHLAQGRHRAGIPRAVPHVVVAVALGHVGLAGLVLQQTEEDRRHLGAGDILLGIHHAVGITHHISVVVLPVQAGRHIIRDGNRRRRGPGAGRIPGKGRVDLMGFGHVFKRVFLHRANALVIYLDVLNVVAIVGRDLEGLGFTLGYFDRTRRVDLAVGIGGGGDENRFYPMCFKLQSTGCADRNCHVFIRFILLSIGPAGKRIPPLCGSLQGERIFYGIGMGVVERIGSAVQLIGNIIRPRLIYHVDIRILLYGEAGGLVPIAGIVRFSRQFRIIRLRYLISIFHKDRLENVLAVHKCYGERILESDRSGTFKVFRNRPLCIIRRLIQLCRPCQRVDRTGFSGIRCTFRYRPRNRNVFQFLLSSCIFTIGLFVRFEIVRDQIISRRIDLFKISVDAVSIIVPCIALQPIQYRQGKSGHANMKLCGDSA